MTHLKPQLPSRPLIPVPARSLLDLPNGWPRGRPLRLEGVRLDRGSAEILRGIDLDLHPDHRSILVGPSGSGKSTLLRLLNRLEDPTSGRISLGEDLLTSLPVRLLRRSIAVVPQDPRPLPGSIGENLRYPSEAAGLPPPTDSQLSDALSEFGLPTDQLDRDASGLSGGERRRLAIAVALQTAPEILVLDEPTAGLDPASTSRLIDALRLRARSDGLRTLVVTHDRRFAPALGEEAFVIDAGRVVDRGPTAEVLRRADAKVWGIPGEAGESSP